MVIEFLIVAFVGLFIAAVIYGHVLLLGDIWQAGKSPAQYADVPEAMRVPAE